MESAGPKGSGHDDDSFTYMDDESASNHTSSIYADDAMPGDICPFAIDQYTTDYDFVTMSATKCGSTACCKFQPLTQYILTWKKYEIEPVTVGSWVASTFILQSLTVHQVLKSSSLTGSKM